MFKKKKNPQLTQQTTYVYIYKYIVELNRGNFSENTLNSNEETTV